jgi:hypothetical protein
LPTFEAEPTASGWHADGNNLRCVGCGVFGRTGCTATELRGVAEGVIGDSGGSPSRFTGVVAVRVVGRAGTLNDRCCARVRPIWDDTKLMPMPPRSSSQAPRSLSTKQKSMKQQGLNIHRFERS